MKKSILLPLFVTVFLSIPFIPAPVAGQGLSGTYTINAALVTGGANFRSFADAIDSLLTRGVSGPVTFEVDSSSGPYNERIHLTSVYGASGTNRITINGNGATLQFAPTTLNSSIIDLHGADYVTISNLRITGTSASAGIGIVLRAQANYIRILNCVIDMSAVTSTGSGSACIAVSGSVANPAIAGDNAQQCVFEGNTLRGGVGGGPYYGIRINGTSTSASQNHEIVSNVIEDFYSTGIYLTSTSGVIVRGNSISRPTRSNIGEFFGIVLGASTRSEIVEKNRIHTPFGGNLPYAAGRPTTGIQVLNPATPIGYESTVRNNLIYNLHGDGTVTGISCSSASYVRVCHNTISLDDRAASAGTTYGIHVSGTATPGPEIKNNLISITRTGGGTKYCV